MVQGTEVRVCDPLPQQGCHDQAGNPGKKEQAPDDGATAPRLVEQNGDEEAQDSGHSNYNYCPHRRTQHASSEGGVPKDGGEVGETRKTLGLSKFVDVVDREPKGVNYWVAEEDGAK
jgi:hypothetical protein